MRRLQMQLFFTQCALILSWLLFFGFGIYSWKRLNDIERYSVTYDCELAEKLESTPIEVRYKCAKLKGKNEKTGS